MLEGYVEASHSSYTTVNSVDVCFATSDSHRVAAHRGAPPKKATGIEGPCCLPFALIILFYVPFVVLKGNLSLLDMFVLFPWF